MALYALEHGLRVEGFLLHLRFNYNQFVLGRHVLLLLVLLGFLGIVEDVKHLLHTLRMASVSAFHSHHWVMDLELL